MKIQYWCSIGRGPEITKILDTEKDFGISDEEWNQMSKEEQEEGLEDWAMENVSYGIKEL